MEIRLKSVRGIPFVFWSFYSFILFSLQVVQGTSVFFSSCILCFHIFWGFAFNLLGGLSSVMGWLILLLGIRQVLLSQLVKVLIWQPADFGLKAPELTGMVYSLGGIIIFLVSLMIFPFRNGKRAIIKPHRENFSPILPWVIFGIGVVSQILFRYRFEVSIYWIPLVNLLSYFQPLTLLGLAYQIQRALNKSHGRQFFSVPVLIIFVWCLFYGMVGSTKLLMFEPFFVLFAMLVFNSYEVKKADFISGLIALGLIVFVLTPLSNHGRYIFRKGTFFETVPNMIEYLNDNFSSTEKFQDYLESLEEEAEKGELHEKSYYGRSHPLLERFSLIHDADALISNYVFREPEGMSFLSDRVYLLPRSLTGKWVQGAARSGDFLGQLSGLISEEDYQTSISFGMFAESFAIGGWVGLVGGIFTILFSYLLILRYLDVPSGDKIWTVFLIAYLQHSFSETGIIDMILYIFRLFPLLFLFKKLLEAAEAIEIGRRKNLRLRTAYN